MKHLSTVIWFAASGWLCAANSVINLSIGQLRDASGNIMEDNATAPENSGVWAVIVSAIPGTATTNPVNGSLPGGLEDNSSLTEDDAEQARIDFNGLTLTAGSYSNFTIHQVGEFTSGNDLGLNGVVQTTVVFDIFEAADPSNDPGYVSGTLWGFYWFPGQTLNAKLSGSFQVGGFANSTANIASGGYVGTTVLPEGDSDNALFYETNFNQNEAGEDATGLDIFRFTAINVIPEPSALAMAFLGFALLLLRRRD